ncbi:hypothetical protein SRB5_30820 [Streptomyces sp. RB5]|uniref:DUF4760 domain-containing protein n=1 Tax=Streptomyces smaragdinus TaxID=2585196 RepID=A0A7K0CI04_9ACTN|nr:DUF6082 family protein [Streptomyces smaragdinus]MQY12943.1 hypothetical protein [Streptomyces smaragdinus]
MSNAPHGHHRSIGAAFAVALLASVGVIALVSTLSLAIAKAMKSIAGDDVSFDPANAVFSGLAFAVVVVALTLQQRQLHHQNERLTDQLEEMTKSNGLAKRNELIEMRRLHMEMIGKALDNPELVPVLDTYDEEIPLELQRQFLYANLLFCHLLNLYTLGQISEPEAYGYLRTTCHNEIFRQFWKATREHRRSLRYESEEAYLGRIVDGIISRMEQQGDWWNV